MRGRVLSLVASGLALGLLGAALMPVGSLVTSLFALAAVSCFMAAFFIGLHERKRDPYDLDLLREVHEREEVRQIEESDEYEFGSVVCPVCQTVYDSRIPACPNCGRAF